MAIAKIQQKHEVARYFIMLGVVPGTQRVLRAR